ncbi:hypothetical protein ASE63_11380 [Bosea sp. Root381]|uniref:hypothetical protein n=1 Tax=Bosea sp. Root381 TaxID=1736524 RepID=UPI0006FD38E7|nr:hypothetical protein [Bosea sp. Root381]KRD96293.1 hypothetical protein ASE63_11380 [Bosea sp. Root381]
MNALPIARSNDWTGEAPPSEAQNAESLDRLATTQHGFLELRLEAALGRLTAMTTLFEAQRLQTREAQAATLSAERALERQRETNGAALRRHEADAAEIERLKRDLQEAALDRARQERRIAAATSVLAGKMSEIERLNDAVAAAETEQRSARAKQGNASDALLRECLRLEEALQGERRDRMLLQRALELARASRRALQDQIDRREPLPCAVQAAAATATVPPTLAHPEHPPADAALLPSPNGAHHAVCH